MMEIEHSSNRPFVIRRNQNRTLLPPESSVFDERVENYVHFVQGANAFIAVFEIYDSIRVFYSHFFFTDKCNEYSYYLIALGILNLIWILVSIVGIVSINSKQSVRVTRFFVLLILIFLSRLAFYIVMEINMSQILEEQSCDFIYQGGLYIINAILECVLLVTLMSLTFAIKNYIKSWENTQNYGRDNTFV